MGRMCINLKEFFRPSIFGLNTGKIAFPKKTSF